MPSAANDRSFKFKVSSIIAVVVSFFALLVLSSFVRVGATPAVSDLGAGSGGVTISPTQRDVSITSGLIEANAPITLTNHTGKTLTANVRGVDFTSQGEFGSISLSAPNQPLSKYGLAKYLVLPDGVSYTLADGETKQIRVQVQNRADLAPGGHYGAVVVSAGGEGASASSKVSFKQEVVSLLFVKKLGGAQFGLQLRSIVPDKANDVPTAVSMRFKSTGNVYVTPRGFVDVSDPRGNVIAKGTINPDSTIILPETTRKLTTLMQPIGNSTLSGTYKITAHFRYDGQKDFDTQTLKFQRGQSSKLIPILAVLTGVIGLTLMIKILRSRK